MPSVVALGAITGGTNLTVTDEDLHELGLVPGSFSILSGEGMQEVHRMLEARRGRLPEPRVGGSVANSADFIARAGVSCGLLGLGGNDAFGRAYVANCKRTSLAFLSELIDGAVTGHDFYFDGDDGTRTIVWTAGANALLSPDRVDVDVIRNAELVLLDGGALDFGPDSEAAVAHCARTAEDAGVPFVLTLASSSIVDDYRAFFDTYAPRARMVAGNLEQTAVLLGLAPGASLDEVRSALARISVDALVTLDADGAFARFGDDEVSAPTRKIQPVDSVGAGDSFLGAFIVARMKGLSVRKALTVGNVVSGQVIRIQAARLPIGFDVPGLMEEAERMAEGLGD